jgi:two-component system sensor histidine kinase PilS (NtrC family)
MAGRLVMVTTLLLVAVYVEAASEYLLPFNPFYILIGATYALTVFHALALRFVSRLQWLVYFQVVGDLLIISGLVYLTGGRLGGFPLLYPISVLYGSVLLYRGRGRILAVLATLCHASLLVLVRLGWILPYGLGDVPFQTWRQVLYPPFVTAVACTTVAFIGSYFSASLHSASEKLEEAAGRVADLRRLNQVIVSSIHSGLLTTDAAGRVLYVNALGAEILGRRLLDVYGQPLQELFGSLLLSPSALATRVGFQRLDLRYLRPDAAEVQLGLSISRLQSVEGGYLLVFQDLTEIKRLETEVRAKERLAAVGEMAAQLAHEIRNPLGSISGSAQVLLSEPGISAEQAALLDIIRRESKRLSDNLNHFLYQTRASPPPSEAVDLREVIEPALTLLRNGSDVKPGHKIEFEADGGPHLCLADPDKMTQVFWNLARNALEAMPHGGRLRIRLASRGDEVVLSLRDEGRGLPRQGAEALFEPFHSGTAMGTGLGLAIVYRIVREHRGDITVRSVPREGTEFEVHLPMVAKPALA